MAQRKTVTVVFSDVVGSTSLGESLDPEVLREVMVRYFEVSRVALERHGGTLEKFIGDAVVALFGVPVSHEDDALRALRAADEIRTRLTALNDELEQALGVRIAVRTGVHTGEVVVDASDSDGLRASGDTMNTAARLEQSAAAGDILIGALTRELGGDAIVVEAVEQLELKGKNEAVAAYRLVRVLDDAAPYARRDDAPLVGRGIELAALRAALDRAVADRRCALVTVVGAAGVGKSRLVRELLAPTAESVRVLVGRCVSYGEGVTFLPVAEALAPVLGPDPRAAVRDLIGAEERSDVVAEHIAAVLGADPALGSTDETFWAIRRVVEALARQHPLALVVDDVHWAEATLLDLLEYVATFSSDAPMVILATSRPELLEERPSWSAPRENGTLVVLQPLTASESTELAGSLAARLGAGAVRRLVDAADGNPLFLEQLVALNADAADELVVPPSIHALLAARIDQLVDAERRVLECASVAGRRFDRAMLGALLPEALVPEAGAHLLSLARKQFVRPDRSGDADEAFVFVHGLMRDAAYNAVPKAARAELHERLAEVLDARGDDGADLVGFHLAEAVRYRRELGRNDDVTAGLARRASELLAAAGHRALGTGDSRAAAKLLERAVDLVPVDTDAGPEIRLGLARAYEVSGRLEAAGGLLEEVRATARRSGDDILELRAELELGALRSRTDADITNHELASLAERAIAAFEEVGYGVGLASAWQLLHWARFRAAQYEDSLAAAERSAEHARRARDRRGELEALSAIAMAALLGRTPAEEGLRLCDELLTRADGAPFVDAYAARVRGCFHSMQGEFVEARRECRRATELYGQLGLSISAIGVVCESAEVERRAGDLAEAERALREAREGLLDIGDIGYVSWVTAMLARILAERGSYDEARELARSCRVDLQSDHGFLQAASRLAEGIANLGEGRLDEAEAIGAEALETTLGTDMLDMHGDVVLLLADVDRASGRAERAAERFREAIALYEEKGDVVSAERVRERL